MIRLSSIVWLIALAFMGVGLFQMKYSVQAQEKELKTIRRQLAERLDGIHVMEAEWSYLNDPERLAELVRRNTDLVPVTAPQLGEIAQLPRHAAVHENPATGARTTTAPLPLVNAGQAPVQGADPQSRHIQEILSRMGRP